MKINSQEFIEIVSRYSQAGYLSLSAGLSGHLGRIRSRACSSTPSMAVYRARGQGFMLSMGLGCLYVDALMGKLCPNIRMTEPLSRRTPERLSNSQYLLAITCFRYFQYAK